IGISLMGGRVVAFVIGFPIVYGLAWFSQFIAGNTTINYWGLEYVIFALLIGLFISNVIGVPDWLKEAARTEYYIKTGLVILGAGILFLEILQAGAIGIVQALLVVFVVWYACFWLAKKLRVDDELAVMLSTGVSICGVSAAIAACGAIQGDKKKLSYTISLILIVAVPMMVLGPWIAKVLKIPDIVAGAWLGGTLDTTGSVVAASALISEQAMKVGTIVKFSQNVLIGVAAFLLSIWWTLRKGIQTGERPGIRVIWERFPKFVLGFLIASVVFSFLVDPGLVKETKGILSGLRTVWFALAFTSIGLETRFTKLFGMGGGRPAIAFIGAQTFNIIWTLILAYLLFGGYIFPVPAIK
ncbi:MAG: putative sulfate exporter family transporter, partial [Deltaproteobacteria bacterium]|nr:putative sulfate exporter family transporter [Deltaproteobacteria bacterium]